MHIDMGRFTVRLAQDEADVAAAQRLRYSVFVEEMGAQPSDEERAEKREWDIFDPHCRHLLLIDNSAEGAPVVGVYRLLHGSMAKGDADNPGPGFYTATEYDLTPIENYPRETLELGRSCVAESYRGTAAMQLLWMALSRYIDLHDIGLMFGTASFHGTDIEPLKVPMAFLHHHHLAPENVRPRALDAHYVEMNLMPDSEINRAEAMRQLPALMKGYMRLGGFVGDGAFVDHDFNTVDVCLVMDTERITTRYRKFLDQKLGAGDAARILG